MPDIIVEDRKIHFTDTGSGEPVVLVHGSSSSGAQWRALSDRLKDRFRVVAVDLLGYGASTPWNDDEQLRNEDEPDVLRAVIGHVGAPIHLVGHSYGGLAALKLALSDQNLLRSLTLIEPTAFWLLQEAEEHALHAEIRAVADTFVAEFVRGNPDAAVAQYVDYWNGPGAWCRLPDPVRSYILATAGKTRWEWATGFNVDIPLSHIAGLRLPTLILFGERTNATTSKVAELLHDTIPGSKHIAIPDGRHMSPVTHSDLVNDHIQQHVLSASMLDI